MKAIRVHQTGDPNVMKIEEVPDPVPGPGEVLVAVEAIGVNPVDTYIRSGNYGGIPLPYTPGMDAAGIVEKVGDGVTRVKPGDRVYTAGTLSGAYAEKALCREAQVHPLPENITPQQGAGIYIPYATAYRALIQRAHARPGERILVHGASGAVGIAAVQIAQGDGMIVTGTAGTDRGLQLVKEQGASHVYNHRNEGYLQQAVEEATDGKGFDVIIEMLSNVNLDNDLDALAMNGRVVVIGSRGRIEIDPRKTMKRDLSILGMTIMNACEKDANAIHASLAAGLAEGTLNPIIGKAFPLSDAASAHQAVMEPGAYGKIILVP